MRKRGSVLLRSRTSTEFKPGPTAPYSLGIQTMRPRIGHGTRRNVTDALRRSPDTLRRRPEGERKECGTYRALVKSLFTE